jgi:hypothetical protein
MRGAPPSILSARKAQSRTHAPHETHFAPSTSKRSAIGFLLGIFNLPDNGKYIKSVAGVTFSPSAHRLAPMGQAGRMGLLDSKTPSSESKSKQEKP